MNHAENLHDYSSADTQFPLCIFKQFWRNELHGEEEYVNTLEQVHTQFHSALVLHLMGPPYKQRTCIINVKSWGQIVTLKICVEVLPVLKYFVC